MKQKEMLEDLYESLIEKRKNVHDSIVENEDHIRSLESSMKEIEEDDEITKYFSPLDKDKSDETGYRNLDEEHHVLTERIENLFDLMNEYDVQISQLEKLITSFPDADVSDSSDMEEQNSNDRHDLIKELKTVSELILDEPQIAKKKLDLIISTLT